MTLKEIRLDKNLTMKQAGQLVGISESMYSLIESGKRKPSVRTAKRIGKQFKINWIDFFKDVS